MFNKSHKKRILVVLIAVMVSGLFASCNVMTTIWDSIKDRYEPYEFVGEEGDRVLVKFIFDSPSSSTVWLAGSFNNWTADVSSARYPEKQLEDGAVIEMTKNEDTGFWTTTIPLEPGRYQYKYVLDEGRVWSEDINTELVPDSYGGNNSIIIVTAQ